MASMAAPMPQIYERIHPGFVDALAGLAKIELEDDDACMTENFALVAERDGPHAKSLERFDVPLMTRNAEHVQLQKGGIDLDLSEATQLLEVSQVRLASNLRSVMAKTQDQWKAEARKHRKDGTSKVGEKNAHLKALVHPTDKGMKAILQERANAARCQPTVGQMSPEQQRAEYQLEEKFRIHERNQACRWTAAELQELRTFWANLENIRNEAHVWRNVAGFRNRANMKLSAVNAFRVERQQHIQSLETMERELCVKFERAKVQNKKDEAALRNLLARLLAATEVHRKNKLRKNMTRLRLEALRHNIQKEKKEMIAIVRAAEVAQDAYTNGVADSEEQERALIRARASAGREGIAHVTPAALEDALNVTLALEFWQRAKSSKTEEHLALQAQKGDVERQLAEAIRRREDPSTASEEARKEALCLLDAKTDLEERIGKCDQECRALQGCENTCKGVREVLNGFSEFGLAVPWAELGQQAQIEADACFEKFPGLFKPGDRSHPTEPGAALSSSGAEGQLVVFSQQDLKKMIEAEVQERLTRDRSERQARRAARQREEEERRASASSPRTDSLGSWQAVSEALRSEGDAHGDESSSSTGGGFDE